MNLTQEETRDPTYDPKSEGTKYILRKSSNKFREIEKNITSKSPKKPSPSKKKSAKLLSPPTVAKEVSATVESMVEMVVSKEIEKKEKSG